MLGLEERLLSSMVEKSLAIAVGTGLRGIQDVDDAA
jgi:hypothetical protein